MKKIKNTVSYERKIIGLAVLEVGKVEQLIFFLLVLTSDTIYLFYFSVIIASSNVKHYLLAFLFHISFPMAFWLCAE